jgi:hypothetical protein
VSVLIFQPRIKQRNRSPAAGWWGLGWRLMGPSTVCDGVWAEGSWGPPPCDGVWAEGSWGPPQGDRRVWWGLGWMLMGPSTLRVTAVCNGIRAECSWGPPR